MASSSIGRAARRSALLGCLSIGAMTASGATAQSDPPPPPPPPAATAAPDQPPAAQPTPDIIVTGSLLGNVRQEDRASPVLAIDSRTLARTGVTSLGELTRFIPQNVGSTGGLQDLSKAGIDSRDTRSVNLRGLGNGATLVLLNGRRVTPQAGDEFVNLNSLTPDIAVQRVETVLDGASSTYGADAVAGVFNVITDARFRGVKANAQFTGIDASNSWNVQAMLGFGNDHFHSVTSASYRFVDNLQNSDRAVTNFVNTTSAGFPGRFTLLGRPLTSTGGHVVIGGNDYTALYDARATGGTLTVVDPRCGAAGTQSQYAPAAGATFGLGNCLYNYQPKNPIRPRSKSVNIHNDTSFDITPDQTLFAEISYYHQDSSRFGVPSYAQNAGNAIIPANNPYNPFGVPALFLGRAIGAEGFPGGYQYRVQRDTVNQQHYVIGARGKLFADWRYTANLSYSASETIARDRDTDMTLFQAALNGFGGPNCNTRFNGAGPGAVAGTGSCLYYSPFEGDLSKQDPSLIYNLQSDVYIDYKREYYLAEGVANGTLATINGHPLDLAIGAQYRGERSSTGFSDLLLSGFGGYLGKRVNLQLSRDVKSVYAEANYAFIDGLNLDVAARYEDYGGFNTVAPKAALNWRIIPAISLRGSISKAFQAPTLANGASSLVNVVGANLTDPTRVNDTTFRAVSIYGNPALTPQTAQVYNIGATFLPVRRARFSIDYWHYRYDNQILLQSPQAIINANPTGTAVQRDSTGSISGVSVTYFNAPSGTATAGLDGALSYGFEIGGFDVTLRDNVTYLLQYDIDVGSTTPGTKSIVYDGVGYRNQFNQSPLTSAAAPRWRSVAGVDVARGPQALSATWRLTSGVYDDQGISLNTTGNGAVVPVVATRVRKFSVFDFQYNVGVGPDRRYELTLGILNAFDIAPGFARANGYLPTIADPFGRQIYARLGVRF